LFRPVVGKWELKGTEFYLWPGAGFVSRGLPVRGRTGERCGRAAGGGKGFVSRVMRGRGFLGAGGGWGILLVSAGRGVIRVSAFVSHSSSQGLESILADHRASG